MALNFKGNIDAANLAALTSSDVNQYDAYYVRTPGQDNNPDTFAYKYNSATTGSTPSWTSYDPIQVIKDVIYTKVWACKGAPSASSNAAQFPTLAFGCFALDISTGDYYGWDGQWKKWTGTAVISL